MFRRKLLALEFENPDGFDVNGKAWQNAALEIRNFA